MESGQFTFDVSDLPTDTPRDAPVVLDVVDGQDVVVGGDPQGCADFNHIQGDNAYGFEGTCGLVSCQDVLGQFGIDVSEQDVVDLAVQNNWCDVSDNPAESGGTSLESWVEILDSYGIPAHAESGDTLDDLADRVDSNDGVIVGLNAEAIWGDPMGYLMSGGRADHAVTVTGVARDPETGEVVGFYINDSNDLDGDGEADSARFIDAQTMEIAWENAGGSLVATDVPRPGADSAFA
jgi:hypothetical protein